MLSVARHAATFFVETRCEGARDPMADVFISYSKQHRHLTEQLARELEDKGLSVWWDSELAAGESFRQRIQDELLACKAAIVIWTPEAINSDYVLSEAERARTARKLLQARTADVEPHDLPPPFDASHVPLLEDRQSILGGLARLGLLKDFKIAQAAPTALYAGGESRRRASALRRAGWPAAALLAITALAGFAIYRSYIAAPSSALGITDTGLRGRAAATADRFMATLNGGLKDTSILGPEVRLGRRGLMSKTDAIAELHKLDASYDRVSCKADTGSLTVKKAEQAPDGYRAIVATFCDFTDKSRSSSTSQGVPVKKSCTNRPNN